MEVSADPPPDEARAASIQGSDRSAGTAMLSGLPAPLFLISGQQRADVFHRALQAAFDLVRDLLQFLMILFEPRQASRQFVGALLFTAQAVVDHRLQPAEGAVHTI